MPTSAHRRLIANITKTQPLIVCYLDFPSSSLSSLLIQISCSLSNRSLQINVLIDRCAAGPACVKNDYEAAAPVFENHRW